MISPQFKTLADSTKIALPLLLTAISQVSFAASDADVEKLFKEGVFLREQGKVYSAIEALETVISNNSTLQRARLELAVAYFRAMNYAQAKSQAQHVLDDPKTPDNVRLAVMAFLAQIKQDEAAFTAKPHTWDFNVEAGAQYDTNVNVGPNSTILPGNLILSPGSMPKEDWAGTLQLGATHTYSAPTPVRIGETPTRFIWQTSAALFHKGYFNETDFDLTAFSLSTGPGWIAPNQWRSKINLQVDDLLLGGNHLGTFTSVSPSITWNMPSGEFTIDALVMNKDFSRSIDAGRDAVYSALGASYGHLLLNGKIAIQGGIKGFNENADADRFTNKGWEAFGGVNVAAWDHGAVYGRYTYKKSDYKGSEPVYGISRDDHENRYEIGLSHTFSSGMMKDWKLSGSWQRTEARSNVGIYTFDREIAGITLSRMF